MPEVDSGSSQLWWVLGLAMMGLGVLGTVLPVLPGTVLVFFGALAAAWADDFARVSGWTIAVLAVLAVIGTLADEAAVLLGAKRAGASRPAMIGAAIGTVLGIFAGLWALIFLPLAGAMAGEAWARRRESQVMGPASRVGLATWVGLLVAAVVKLAIGLTMVGIFALAYWR
ncbi:DUF456 domain-containing protein [Caldimonas tepidiphila]|uniref:DUF456 domain-containing protein n=1 Tax=Caldimonas tepidiphila TaxID=2315841 RepID=UPI000E5BCD75|nr:DUF456 family protein [Caldimonas tepidiphila]